MPQTAEREVVSHVRVLSPHEERIERGEPVGLIGDSAPTSRARIHRMLDGFRDRPIRLNVDRARLLTESMKATEGQQTVLRWGKALAHVLLHHPIHIEEDELLVGSAGAPGRYAVVYCELGGPGRFYTRSDELVTSEPGDPILVTEEDVATLKSEVLPYWERNQYQAALMNALPEETRQLVGRMFVVTPTATSRSLLAWTHDYGKVLRRGIGSIKREAERKLAALDPFDTAGEVEKRPFLEAVLLVCDAMVAFAHRYADLARALAAGEVGEDRRSELRSPRSASGFPNIRPERFTKRFNLSGSSRRCPASSRRSAASSATVGSTSTSTPTTRRTRRRGGSRTTTPWSCWNRSGSGWPVARTSMPSRVSHR